MLPGALLLASLLGVTQVSGAGTCPTPEDVALRLSALHPADTLASYRAFVDSTGPVVQVELRDTAGAVVAQKVLPAGSGCADLAQAVAVFIAAWAEQVRSAELPGPELPVQVQPLPAPEPALAHAWELGLGAVLGMDPASGGGLLTVALGFKESAWAVELDLSVHSSTSFRLGTGRFGYTPLNARLGPRYQLPLGPLRLAVTVSAVAGIYLLDGSGYAVDQSAFGGRGGAGLQARLGWPLGPVTPWVALLGTGWAQRTRVSLHGTPATRDLSQFEFALAAGLSLGP